MSSEIWQTGGVDPEMEQELAAAADAYLQAPGQLHATILKAAAKGAKPAKITKAIKYAYSPDYVARLVREAKAGGLIPAAGDAES
jgi:hypothetical protein